MYRVRDKATLASPQLVTLGTDLRPASASWSFLTPRGHLTSVPLIHTWDTLLTHNPRAVSIPVSGHVFKKVVVHAHRIKLFYGIKRPPSQRTGGQLEAKECSVEPRKQATSLSRVFWLW